MNETTSGAPLTATVGERLSGDPHLEQARKAVAASGKRAGGGEAKGRREGGGEAESRRAFPWGTLALMVIGWAFATAIGRRVRSRARRGARRVRTQARRGASRVREAAAELGHGARRLARR
jgi:hypothetical protein